jgi:predicted DNA-binding transcriptional regulator AlpA
VSWYDKAVRAADRIESAHTSPWKLVTAYALLSIAESLASSCRPLHKQSGELRCANEKCAMYQEPGTLVSNGDQDILTLAEVAEMSRQAPATLRYWRYAGEAGPKSFKLGRRIMYRRADVEQWLADAHGES